MAKWFRRIADFFRRDKPGSGTLYVFDFDKTIIYDGSELAIGRLLAVENLRVPPLITAHLRAKRWTPYWQGLFNFILQADNGRIKMDQVIAQLKNLPVLQGMDTLLSRITLEKQKNKMSKLIIISGSNTLFVETILGAMNPPIVPDMIISNTAKLIELVDGRTWVEFDEYEPRSACQFCEYKLCKGDALIRYYKDFGPFVKTVYVGDGTNDVCAAIKLREQDVLFARKYHNLQSVIKSNKYKGQYVQFVANIQYFETGDEVRKKLRLYDP